MLANSYLKHWQRCALLMLSVPALAGASDVEALTKNPQNWAMQAGGLANQRYSELKQINKDNAKNLTVAWTFSTGVLRGHEGGPLVVGDMMYVHSPFPNQVYAISLEDQSMLWKYEPKQDPSVIAVMCCDTVSRGVAYSNGKIFLQQADTTLVALDAKTGKELWKVVTGNPKAGETATNTPHVFKDKVITGISGGEFGVRGRITAYDMNTGKEMWKAFSTGPDEDMRINPTTTMTWTDGKMAPVGRLVAQNLEGRPMENRRRHHLGLVQLRSGDQFDVLRQRQPEHMESAPAARRQQVVDDDFRARPRHRRSQMGLPNDAA